ncbi:MAG: SUF system NifU family Fe-S cluster assembly protein [Thermoanaerobaculia bacterium]|nr:SUF system NifU family Fe-S cluster assembly protein [Thermoanaerobaculia bacterium]
MSDLKQLYQEVILDHYRKPRNFGVLGAPRCEAAGHNPLCGDRVKVFLRVDGERVEDIAFEGAGCAISTASASLMTEAVKGKSVADVKTLFSRFRDMVTGNEVVGAYDLGKLEALAGVRDLPVRVKCATLAWHTLQAALDDQDELVTTE